MTSPRFNRPTPRPARAAIALAAVLAMLPLASAQAASASDATTVRATQDTSHALVQLVGDPLATAARSKPPKGKKIDFSSTSVKAHRAQLSALRNDYKQWLRANAPQARVTGEFDLSLNAVSIKLNGATLEQVSAAPQVKAAQYQGLYYPNAVDPDLALISATQAWARNGGTEATAGAGVKVAIVDSGVDQSHPCFADSGYAAQAQAGDKRFTNNKVVAARVFNNKLPQNGFTAEAIGAHGTHVAGTVACNFNTSAIVQGVTIPHGISGVAPRALLGNYNVFPGSVENARSEDILNALEAAYQDGFDVANMSLGGGSHGVQDLLVVAVDNLDQANMVVAVSAGNSGPGKFTVGSPGMATRALTAGASAVPHFIGTPVKVGASTYGAVSGAFAVVGADLTAALGVVSNGTALGNACAALPAGSLAGQIALLSRGTCAFSVKIRNAQVAGAVAVLVANNVAGDPAGMASDGTPDQPTIPAYMVGQATGQALKTQGGVSVTIGATQAYVSTPNADIMAGFSSQGPTDVDFRIKPDVVAPGANVLSSIPVKDCGAAATTCFAFFNGTSMAAPHLAGSAAVVRGQHPTWSAAEIRSAVVNTADRNVLRDFATAAPVADVNIVGAGRENLLSAVSAPLALDPVSLSFGAVPSGSGQARQLVMTVTNLSGVVRTLGVAVGGAPADVGFSVSPASLQLGAGESRQVTVTMTADRGAAAGHKQAVLDITEGGQSLAHAALYTLVK